MEAIRTSLLVVITAAFSFSFTTPDDPGIARIDSNYCITLEGSDIQDQYLIDISALGIDTREEAREVFGYIMNNLRDFEQLDLTAQTIVMNVHLDRTGSTPWTKTEWDEYFTSLCE